MRVLVTGGAGFIGSHLVERLLARGDHVVVIDNLNDYYDPRLKRRNIESSLANKAMTFLEGDILNGIFLDKVFGNHSFNVVVHLAARAGVRPSLKNPLLYEEVNCRGTLNILEQLRRNEIHRFVFASSSSVYGNVKEVPFREDARVDRPVSPYAATKAAGELYCHNYHHLHGISTTALRFFTAYGPRQRPDMAIHKFTRLIDEGLPIPFYGDGTSERDYTFIDDIVDGVVSAVDKNLGFEIINLGESRTTSLSELVAIIEKTLGKNATLQKMSPQPGDVEITCADVSKARKLLGYNPSTSVENGVERFVQWYMETRA
ncbi:MAG: GDP-mannose 4,6-dehydratase [Lentisphaerae bacterium]|nr:GDP-mannose 4,6-dehydratase [Lentisphaerota bacterium]